MTTPCLEGPMILYCLVVQARAADGALRELDFVVVRV